MEINDLIIFKTVVNEGSISKAAEELGYVQPNITERIKKLEQELETQLLHRSNQGISLLPPGETLLEYTDKILNLLEEAKHEIKVSGKCYRIGTTQSILANYLSSRIKENLQHYQIYMENSQQLQQLLKKQKVDLVLTYGEYSDPALQKVFSQSISMGLQKAKGKWIKDYSNEFFFASHDKHCPFRGRTIEFMETHHLPKKQLQQVDSFSLITEMVAQGKGLAFLPIHNDNLEFIEAIQIEKIAIHFFTNLKSKKEIPSELMNG